MMWREANALKFQHLNKWNRLEKKTFDRKMLEENIFKKMRFFLIENFLRKKTILMLDKGFVTIFKVEENGF